MAARRWTAAVLAATFVAVACSDSTGPRKASQLVFEVDPVPVGPGSSFFPTVVVGVADGAGNLVTDWTDTVTLTLQGGGGAGTLQGDVTATPENGLSAFGGLTAPAPGLGYTLVARSSGLPDATSASFDVPDVLDAASVYAADAYSCALDGEGAVWCWGLNDHGELGDGTTQARSVAAASASGLRFASLSLGGQHTCGLTDAGAVYCWGQNDDGEVGTGATSDVLSPQVVTLPAAATQVSAGGTHTCALLQDGSAYCWGDNRYGEAGTGSQDTVVSTPQLVAGGITFTSVSTGMQATCGLAVGGAAYCWGRNRLGELGDGTQVQRSVPTAVSGGKLFRELAMGTGPAQTTTCGIEVGGQTDCWGEVPVALVPTPVPGDPGLAVLFVGGHDACGVTADGSLYCWGRNRNGQFANGSTLGSDVPVPVLPDHHVLSASLGWSHVCAVTTDGETWCWGTNTYGELGNASNPFGWLVAVPVWAPEE
jgi:alpha-tubulin suppressor-like RCC1 family protein